MKRPATWACPPTIPRVLGNGATLVLFAPAPDVRLPEGWVTLGEQKRVISREYQRPWTGEVLTVGGELNKLASSIALARDAADIHWRTGGWEGLKLGEQVAMHILRDLAGCYAEVFGGFALTRFDGT